MNQELILDYARRRENAKPLDHWQGRGESTDPTCGDILRISFSTQREIITQIAYTITETACAPARASACAAIELAEQKPVMAAYLIDAAQIAQTLCGLDEAHMHCAMMAELALKRAILDYAARKKNG